MKVSIALDFRNFAMFLVIGGLVGNRRVVDVGVRLVDVLGHDGGSRDTWGGLCALRAGNNLGMGVQDQREDGARVVFISISAGISVSS